MPGIRSARLRAGKPGVNNVMTFDVELEGVETPLVAVVERNGDDYQVRQWFQAEASTDIDWYDNSLHKAYVDVSDQIGMAMQPDDVQATDILDAASRSI